MVSVVVACRNEVKELRSFLDSVLRQEECGENWEVIIADGMSEDGTRELLEEYSKTHSRIRVIDNVSKIVSTGLNSAIRAARGEIIIRMDAHTEYARDYIRRCLETLDRTGADNVGGPPRVNLHGLRLRALGAAYHSPFAVGGSKSHDVHYEGYVDSVFYGCWRKGTLERLGMFDESLVRNQDDELNFRLTRSGGRIWQSPTILCWYRPRTALSDLCRQYFQYGFWKVPVILKHRALASWRHLAPGAFVVFNLIFLLACFCALVTGPGIWFFVSLKAWAIVAGSYAAACVAASYLAAREHGWRVFLFLPPIFAIYHGSYGLGFVLGTLYWPLGRFRSTQPGRLFTNLTR